MNDQSPQTNTLFILTGSQQGAAAPLAAGRYLLGSGDDCDLVLRGEGIAPSHALLVLDGEGGTIEALAPGVTIGGKAITDQEPCEFGPGDTLGLGEIYLGIGRDAGDFEIPTEQAATAEEEEEDAEQEQASEEPLLEAAEQGNRNTVEQPGALPATSGSGALHGLLQAATAGRFRGLVTGVVAVLALILLVESVPPLHRLFAATPETVAAEGQESALHRTNTLLHSLAFDHVEAALTGSGGVILTGHATSDDRVELLDKAALTLPFPVQNKVWSEEGLQAKVQETLHQIGAGDLKVAYQGRGSFSISGYYDGAATAEQLVTILRSDVPQVAEVSGKLDTLQDGVAMLREMVRDLGLNKELRIKASGSRVEVGGSLDPHEMAEWRDIAAAFALKVGAQPKILDLVSGGDVTVAQVHADTSIAEPVRIAAPVAQAAPARPTQKSSVRFPHIVVTGVIVPSREGGHYLALLESGATLYQGDVIDEQYVVEKIEFNKVTLRSGDQVHSYYVGDHHG